MRHDKLVRDRIPGIILAKGGPATYHIAGDEEYGLRLRAKLAEEAAEAWEAETSDALFEELADVLEVVEALCEHYGFNRFQLEGRRRDKQKERGAFAQRIVLDEA